MSRILEALEHVPDVECAFRLRHPRTGHAGARARVEPAQDVDDAHCSYKARLVHDLNLTEMAC
jgi:hypothetical protein